MFGGATRASTYLKLLRGVRYVTIEEAVGQPVQVRSEASVIADVLAALRDVLPTGLSSVRAPARGLPTVAKYALLDLEFAVPPGAATRLRRLSLRQLTDLGLLPGSGAARPELEASEDADACVAELLEGIAAPPILKVILDAADDRRSVQRRIADTAKGIPRGYLPATFLVRDCCITNAPTLWLGKHFYL